MFFLFSSLIRICKKILACHNETNLHVFGLDQAKSCQNRGWVYWSYLFNLQLSTDPARIGDAGFSVLVIIALVDSFFRVGIYILLYRPL